MKVILVNGSPHPHGCTDAALTEVETTLQSDGIDTNRFWIGNKAISGCISCSACNRIGKCSITDVVNEFVQHAYEADGFIFGSPVHYAAMAGNMTSFMDRVFYSAFLGGHGKALQYKPAGVVLSARRGGTTAAYDQFNKYFGISEMPIISSQYWNMVHGTTPDEVKRDLEGMQIMRTLGRNMAYFLKCIEAGKNAGIMLPKRETPVKTSFIRE